MRPRSVLFLATLLALFCPRVSSAQSHFWVDSTVTRLAWGNMNVLVIPDTSAGLRLWVETSKLYHRGDPHRFIGRFAPGEALDRWLAQAEVLIESERPSDSTVTRIRTAGLMGLDSSTLVLSRDRKGRDWESRIRFTLNPGPDSRDHPWEIGLEKPEAKELVLALFHGAGISRFRARPAWVDTARVETSEVYDESASNPPSLQSGSIAYPPELGGREGEVWASYMVDETGRADPASLRVYLSDDPAFTREVRNGLALMKFHPAIIGGQPIRVLVSQQFTFTRSTRRLDH